MIRPGQTMIELVVALLVLSLLATVTTGLLRRSMNRYREREAILQAEQSARIGLSALVLELQDLDAADSAGGDLLEISPSSVTYRSMMNLYFVCRPPDPGTGRVTAWGSPRVGSQAFDVSEQMLLLRAVGDSARDRWLNYAARGVETGHDCPGGQGSVSFLLNGATFGALNSVPVGAPIRGYRLTRIHSYRDSDGIYWVGIQTRTSFGDWAATQPIAGPLAPGGLALAYSDALGGLSTTPQSVARISLRLTGISDRGRAGLVSESEVWLRNNPDANR